MISIPNSVLVFGGDTSNQGPTLSTIIEYSNDIWTVIGNLRQSRKGHSAIQINSLIMIVGGGSSTNEP